MTSGARLTELDLSDNAFGPDGVKGIETLLKSPVCYTLRKLKLNNCGMGIGGGKVRHQHHVFGGGVGWGGGTLFIQNCLSPNSSVYFAHMVKKFEVFCRIMHLKFNWRCMCV